MPGCAAIGCNNRSEKGYSMKCFPRDPALRQTWKEKVGRANWEPSKNSFLCHDHFAPDQWAANENGKVKLKRDAIPSIFRETSTRKSPRKRRLTDGIRNSNIFTNSMGEAVNVTIINLPNGECEDDNNYTLEYLENCKYKPAFAAVNNTDEIIMMNSYDGQLESKKNYQLAYRIISSKDVRGLDEENIIIVSDENDREIGKFVHDNENIIIVADENDKEIGQIVVNENLISQQNFRNKVDDYEGIEEKLKLICEGEGQDGTDLDAEERKIISYKSEPIFEEEKSGKSEVTKNRDTNSSEYRKISFGDDEETVKESHIIKKKSLARILRIGEPSEAPVMTTPLKSQKRTGDDVMRSIKSALAELSESTVRSVKNDLTQSVMRIDRTRQKWNKEKKESGINCEYKLSTSERIKNTFESDDSNISPKKPKFIIKVQEAAGNSESIEGLDTSSIRVKTENNREENTSQNYVATQKMNERDCIIDKVFSTGQDHTINIKSDERYKNEFDSIFLTENCVVKEENNEEYRRRIRNPMTNVKREITDSKSLIKRNNNHSKKLFPMENQRIKMNGPSSEEDINRLMRLKYSNKSQDPIRRLRQKLNAQQEVIEKLTDQLIIYKGLEAKLASLKFQFQIKVNEIQLLKDKLEQTAQIPVRYNESDPNAEESDLKEKIITDLSKKVNRLKETNKKLMQQISAETSIRKSAYNMKQKDDRIKELNWKLEKASKFLERAEKNANTYKRKMVSLQTAMRRQKASDEKRHHFQELLIDNAKHEFSESALLTAMDIKNSCGVKCYQKLLSYDFPLPSLRTLRRRFQKENVTEDDWGDEDPELVVYSTNQNDQTITEAFESNELGESQVTGTVQDIFEENNDTEELNSNELGEQMFLELQTDAKYTET